MRMKELLYDDDEGVVINADDVHIYLGTLTTDDAVELATDCLVNGIAASRMGGSSGRQQQQR